MDTTQLYRIYRRVVECESFSRAADHLQIPRSTVSAAISLLEKELGVRLINRTTRKIAVTSDGQQAYRDCCDILDKIDLLKSQFRTDGKELTGKIRVNVPSRIGRLILLPAISQFLDQHSGISLDVGMSDRQIDLVEGGVDCVLRAGLLKDSRLIQRKMVDIEFINVASPSYIERFGMPLSLEELDSHWLVAYASSNGARIEPFEWVEHGTVANRQMANRITVDSAEGLIEAALCGLGIAQVPRFDVQAHIRRGELIEILPDHTADPIALSIVYAHKEHVPARLRLFIDWLERLIRSKINAD